jgi:low affinity Fe/Cu permease
MVNKTGVKSTVHTPPTKKGLGALCHHTDPIGIYVVSGLIIVGAIVSLCLGSFVTDPLSDVLAIVGILLAIGLLFKVGHARILLIILSGVLIVLQSITILTNVALEHRDRQTYQNSISQLQQLRAKPTNDAKLDAFIDASIVSAKSYDQKSEASLNMTYPKDGIMFFYSLISFLYLIRPSVKKLFK